MARYEGQNYWGLWTRKHNLSPLGPKHSVTPCPGSHSKQAYPSNVKNLKDMLTVPGAGSLSDTLLFEELPIPLLEYESKKHLTVVLFNAKVQEVVCASACLCYGGNKGGKVQWYPRGAAKELLPGIAWQFEMSASYFTSAQIWPNGMVSSSLSILLGWGVIDIHQVLLRVNDSRSGWSNVTEGWHAEW